MQTSRRADRAGNIAIRNTIFHFSIAQLRDLESSRDLKNTRYRRILKRYPMLQKSYNALYTKAEKVSHSRNNSIFTNLPFIGDKKDSEMVEVAVSNLFTILKDLDKIESSHSFRRASINDKRLIRDLLDSSLQTLSRKYIPHSVSRNILTITVLTILIIGSYVLAAAFPPASLFALIMTGVSTALFLFGGTPAYNALLTLKYQFSSEQTKTLNGFGKLNINQFQDLVKQFSDSQFDLQQTFKTGGELLNATISTVNRALLEHRLDVNNIVRNERNAKMYPVHPGHCQKYRSTYDLPSQQRARNDRMEQFNNLTPDSTTHNIFSAY